MNDASTGLLLFRHVPYFLDADSKHLRVAIFVQIEFCDELFGQGPARTFRENRDLCPNIDSRFEIASWLSELIDAFVARPHANDGVALDEKVGPGESCKYIDAAFFDLLAEPSSEL